MQSHRVNYNQARIVISICLTVSVIALFSLTAKAQRSRGEGVSRSGGSSGSSRGSSSGGSSRSSGGTRSSGSSSSSSSSSSGTSRRSGGNGSSSHPNRSRGTSGGSSSGTSSGGSSSDDSASSLGRPSSRSKDRDRSGRPRNDNSDSSRRNRERSTDSGSSTVINNGGRNRAGRESKPNPGDDTGDGDRSRHHRRRGFDRHRDGNRDEWCRREYEWGRTFYVSRPYLYSNYGNYQYSSNAYDNGYKDGLFTGANDARRGQSYDPERSHFYKHAGGGFLSVFGHPATYSTAYRDGFLRGYGEGFSNWQSYFIGDRFHR